MPFTLRRACLLLVAALVAVGGSARAGAAVAPDSRPQAGSWTLLGFGDTNFSVEHVAAAARHGDTLYLGGDFTGLGRRAVGIGAFDPDTGGVVGPAEELDRHPNAALTTVSAAIAAPDGGVYVAGVFGGAGGVGQQRLLHLTADGRLDPAFEPGLDFGGVTSTGAIVDMALSPDGRRLYLAGGFTSVGGQVRSQLAALDAGTGAVTGWQPQVAGGTVTRVVAGAGAVYVAGTFTSVHGAARRGIAALSPADGTPTAFDPQPNATGTVRDVAVAGSTVYLAGLFGTLDGAVHARLAAVDAATGAPSAWAPPLSGARVAHIAVTAGTVYANGTFSVAGAPRNFAAFDRATAADRGWSPTLAKEASAMTLSGDRVYVGYSGAKDDRCGLAAVDATTGATTAWDPHLGTMQSDARSCAGFTVTALVAGGDRIWAGGTFDVANVAPRAGAAAIDLATNRLTPWAPSVEAASGTARVNAIAVSGGGSTVYLGGTFSSVGGQARGNLAAVSASGPGAPVPGWGNAVNGVVRTLALNPQGNRLYVGGAFTAIGQFGRAGIGSVSATTGGVSAAWKPQAVGASGGAASVRDVAVGADGTVYLAGSFARIGFPTSVARAGLAAIDGDGDGAATGAATAWDAGLPPGTAMRTLALDGDRLYAGGAAAAVDAATSLGAFAVASGARIGAFGAAVNGEVYRVTVADDGTVYVVGAFSRLTGPGGADVARANAGALTADGTPTAWAPQPSAGVGDPAPAGVLAVPGGLVLGGSFSTLGGTTIKAYGLAVFGPALAPIAGRTPAVAGTPALGTALRCTPGRFGGSPGASTWAWLRDGAAIDGQGSDTYTVRATDLGRALSCRQTVTNTAGSAAATSDAVAIPAPPPALDTAPAVAGDTWDGGLATCTTGLWRNAPDAYAYRWLLDGAELAGETGARHRIAEGERGHALACEVTASSPAGSATARSAPVTVTEPPPTSVAAPRIGGDAIVGGVLACDAGGWDGARTLSYAWLRDDVLVDGRTTAAYVATSQDLGHALTCVVTARNEGGERSVASAAVVVVPSAHTAGIDRRRPIAEVGGAVAGASITRLDVRGGQLAKTGRRLVLRVAAPVTGTLTVRLTRGRTTYGTATVKVKRRATVTVRIALSAKTARTIRAKGAGGLTVTATARLKPAKGATQKDFASLRLRLTTTTSIG